MKAFFSLLNASFKEFIRDRMAIFWTFAFPVMFIFIFGLLFSNQEAQAYPVGVVLEDESDQAALGFFCMYEMADREDGDDPAISKDDLQLCQPWFEQAREMGLTPPETGEETPSELPLYLHRGTFEKEINSLQNGDRQAVLVFPENFGERINQGLNEGDVAANVKIHYDASQTTSAQIILSILSSLLDAYDRQLSGTSPLIRTELETTTAEQFNYLDFFVPGVAAVSLMQLGLFGALTLVSLRERQILKRLGATPLSRRTLVLSQIALRLMIALAQTAIILAFGRLAFGVQLGDQIPLMIGFILLGGLTFVAMGYMVAALARTEAAGNAISPARIRG